MTPPTAPLKPPDPFTLLLSAIAHDNPCDLPSYNITRLTQTQLNELLKTAPQTPDGKPILHHPNFERVTFKGGARFTETTFTDETSFDETTFEGKASFNRTTFKGKASFNRTTFKGKASFNRTTFTSEASFNETTFTSEASFNETTFEDRNRTTFKGRNRTTITPETRTSFDGTTFKGKASFNRTTFEDSAHFNGTTFEGWASFNGTTFEGGASFNGTTFEGWASFDGTTFTRSAFFDRTTFTTETIFDRTTFEDSAIFNRTTFTNWASFNGTIFTSEASFNETTFTNWASFNGTIFTGEASFDETTFTGEASFNETTFTGEASFNRTTFTGEASFNRTTFTGRTSFNRTTFEEVVGGFSIISLGRVTFSGARFARGGTLRFSGGEIVLDDMLCDAQRILIGSHNTLPPAFLDATDVFAVLLFPLISKTGSVFVRSTRTHYASRLLSLRRVDASMLTLSGLDLSVCSFDEVHHLDRLRFEQDPTFRWPPPRSFPKRQVLFQEALWRAEHSRFRKKWDPPTLPQNLSDSSLKPKALAQIYRNLRKGREDEKNEPGAADFYYGEMEMRRRSDSWGTRRLLDAYWTLSGYGLQPLRSFIALAILLVIATLMLNVCGFKEPAPPVAPLARASVLGMEFELGLIQEELNTRPSLGDAFLFVTGSLVSVTTFNPEVLTSTGQAIRVILRFIGPILLGLTVLAVRGRVKR